MKTRWYFSTFIIILTLFGAISQQQSTVPNQEIVLQFVDVNISSEQAQNTIANVKAQLQVLGADNVQVVEDLTASTLKITYYSDADVSRVKRMLSNEKKVALDFTSQRPDEDHSGFPSEKKTSSYNIDVYDIVNGSDSDSGFGGKHALQRHQEFDRYLNPIVFPFSPPITVSSEDNSFRIVYTVNENIAIAISNTPHKIPEGRAGPSVHRIS